LIILLAKARATKLGVILVIQQIPEGKMQAFESGFTDQLSSN